MKHLLTSVMVLATSLLMVHPIHTQADPVETQPTHPAPSVTDTNQYVMYVQDGVAYYKGGFFGGITELFEREYAQNPYHSVVISSPGGMAIEGITLGRFFHDIELKSLKVEEGEACLSACAFAALGAKHVHICNAILAFHRPFLSPDNMRSLSLREYQSAVFPIMSEVLAFIMDMDMSVNLYHAIAVLTTPSSFIMMSSDDQLDVFRLGNTYDVDFSTFKSTSRFNLVNSAYIMSLMVEFRNNPHHKCDS